MNQNVKKLRTGSEHVKNTLVYHHELAYFSNGIFY